jgi:hypothetical protein
MKMRFQILSTLACVALMTACSGSKEEPEKPVSQDTISITDEAGQAVTTLKASATNAPINLSVTANFDWATRLATRGPACPPNPENPVPPASP